MQEGAPKPRKQRAKSAAPVTTQQPLTDVQPAPSDSGGLSDSTGGPPPVPVTCSVATMTGQRPLSPGGWGEIVKEDEDSHPPAYGSPKMRRTQGRLRVPHLQDGECAARYSEGEVRETHLLEGEELLDLDQTPTLVPEVQIRGVIARLLHDP
ncbi:hypothetical protein Q5P01_009435 [Channa striata]|uniref:Uncharacterized protein n=1 Tax=Channa striata TaxID=64152 RepID=A0AA88N0M1_CHASR|nr:hypothetical protein Q5P01_009435 [Channa striata]